MRELYKIGMNIHFFTTKETRGGISNLIKTLLLFVPFSLKSEIRRTHLFYLRDGNPLIILWHEMKQFFTQPQKAI